MMLHILKDRLSMRKTAARLNLHHLTEMATIRCGLNLPGVLWARRRSFFTPYHYAGWDFRQVVQVKTETPINKWCHYGLSRSFKFRQNPSNMKIMVILLYEFDGVIITHTVLPQQTVNAQCYYLFLEHYLSSVLNNEWWHILPNTSIIYHNNAQSHDAQSVTDLFEAGKCFSIHNTIHT